ncbi:MAG: hypothetical protein HOD97_05565 [Candidatus Marinimicrobia bacterium]|jgi:hypothetical protein|uniref:Cohesin domain-containing protein n=1 Tax=uncultured bacterium FGYC_13M19 TaxID=1343844 RepID=S4W452_9BACT|nr:hypothetical protein [uncultured bacterium FGYC_13M19]MBT3215837.1 hypothetical protein [Candidatus Neomarinimicrobiota bacterium]MBT3217414.1 hypothetical protein [Candidatus Neomarinimicrobiota bacterium]MBT3618774.1 hypothetical protein [Candidatus Neomarinimicrobiota bacterium]MBT3829479.1 hypothetical protein [Candidatus Neomarinimicrobiota bacterium]
MKIHKPYTSIWQPSVLAIVLLVTSCDLFTNIDNLFDPEHPDFRNPETLLFSGPAEGEIVQSNTVIFSWEHADSVYHIDTSSTSNVSDRIEYSYRLTGRNWSTWESGESLWYSPFTHWQYDNSTGIHSLTLGPLEDGPQLFEVRMKYPTGVFEYNWPMRSFSIDAMEGTALMISPMQTYIDSAEAFYAHVRVLDAVDLMGINLKLQYDPSMLHIREYTLMDDSLDFLLQSHADNLNDFVFITHDSLAGTFDLSIGIAGGNFTGVNGSGALVQFTFDHIGERGNTTIEILDESTLRDINNTTTLNATGDGHVTVW